jgi:hypothetical protein
MIPRLAKALSLIVEGGLNQLDLLATHSSFLFFFFFFLAGWLAGWLAGDSPLMPHWR